MKSDMSPKNKNLPEIKNLVAELARWSEIQDK